jgi:hypothetical protein
LTDFSGDDLIGDAGPEFDPQTAPPSPELEEIDEELAELDEGWLEEQIRDLLVTQGSATNWLLRITPDDDSWIHTQEDLRSIAPPLTRILNRYDATRAAAAAGDEVALGAALFNYAARNYTKRRRIIARLQAIEEPVSGVPAGDYVPHGAPAPAPAPGPEVYDEFDPDAPPALHPRGR